jgi:hypothetical protein
MDANSGCSAGDFAGFVRGHVALLKIGSCSFDSQVANAEGAGAVAVILYNNEGTSDEAARGERLDGGAFQAQLGELAGIPVIGVVSYAAGADLVRQYGEGRKPEAHLNIRTRHRSDIDYNLIADSRFGDPHHVVVVDAHLDAIYGEGMLDNASGSTTILEIALKMAHTRTLNRLRYIWFGGEELGLLGSRYYTHTLTPDDLHKIVFDIDVDVTATPNYAILVADPEHAHNANRFTEKVLRISKIGNRDFIDYFRSIGIKAFDSAIGNNGTDSNSFSLVGVPNTGIFTQQDCCKKQWEVDVWGGYLGDFEGKVPGHNGGCVDHPHRWCDNLDNNDPTVFEFTSQATAAVTLELANDATLRSR